MRRSPHRTAAAAVVLGLVQSASSPGCGPGQPEFDKAALYTPESLAQELVLRYGALNAEARKSTRKVIPGSKAAKRIAAVAQAAQAEKKGGNPEAAKKRTGPQTIDDVLEDIDAKIDKIPGTSRAGTCRQMIEVISKDGSLTEDDKTLLSEKLKELGGTS
jgi:hypothetical protein